MTALARIRLAKAESVASVDAEPGWRAFSSTVERIEALIDAETALLRGRTPADYAEISRRKRQGLLELSRTLPQLLAGGAGAAVRQRLNQLGAKLEQNRSALDVQLSAVREVAEIVERTLKDAESDGTYSQAMAWQ